MKRDIVLANEKKMIEVFGANLPNLLKRKPVGNLLGDKDIICALTPALPAAKAGRKSLHPAFKVGIFDRLRVEIDGIYKPERPDVQLWQMLIDVRAPRNILTKRYDERFADLNYACLPLIAAV